MTFDSLQQKTSYLIGRDMAASFQRQGLAVDTDALVAGLRSALAGEASLIPADEARAAMSQLQRELQAAQQAKAASAAEDNRRAGQEFLTRNKLRADVNTLPSGLQYEVLHAGTPGAASPRLTDRVTTHYHGTLLDGTVFDSSYERGEPATFPVNGVIAGWTEALQRMVPGAKWRLYVPSDLAYGARGAGDDIGPNATLVFDVELLKVN